MLSIKLVSLDKEIHLRSTQFIDAFEAFPIPKREEKIIPFTWGMVSSQDLLAYQLGWGRLLIQWYSHGLTGQEVTMPGEGFTKWDYEGLAKHFFKKYQRSSIQDFIDLVQAVTAMVKEEGYQGRLSSVGAFAWCTLPSGKQWSLEKWIRVNTCSHYKRAVRLLKKALIEEKK